MPSSAVLDLHRRSRRERVLLAAAVVALGLWLVLGRAGRLAETEAAETTRLVAQADAIERNLAWQLQGVAAALRVVRDDLPQWPVIDRPRGVGLRLQALCAAMPGVRSMMLVDAEGVPVAVGGPDGAVDGPAAAGWYAAVRARPDPAMLHVAPPASAPSGEVTLTLAVAVTDAQGALSGAVAATLDPAYFDTLMASMLYAGDMSSRIVHADGAVLVANPPDRQPPEATMASPSSIFRRHLATEQQASVQRGTSR